MALHCGVTRQHIDQLTQQGVIERRPDGLFDQDQSRLRYFAHLRSQHRRSPRAEADAELATAKARWLQLRVLEKEKTLMETSECNDIIDGAIGIVLSTLHSIPAKLFPLDLQGRRRAESVILDARREIADKCLRRAEALEAAMAASERGDDE